MKDHHKLSKGLQELSENLSPKSFIPINIGLGLHSNKKASSQALKTANEVIANNSTESQKDPLDTNNNHKNFRLKHTIDNSHNATAAVSEKNTKKPQYLHKGSKIILIHLIDLIISVCLLLAVSSIVNNTIFANFEHKDAVTIISLAQESLLDLFILTYGVYFVYTVIAKLAFKKTVAEWLI